MLLGFHHRRSVRRRRMRRQLGITEGILSRSQKRRIWRPASGVGEVLIWGRSLYWSLSSWIEPWLLRTDITDLKLYFIFITSTITVQSTSMGQRSWQGTLAWKQLTLMASAFREPAQISPSEWQKLLSLPQKYFIWFDIPLPPTIQLKFSILLHLYPKVRWSSSQLQGNWGQLGNIFNWQLQ